MLASSKRGFTLIELLVVLVISATLLTLIGSLSFEQMARADRLTELNKLEQVLLFTSKQAALNANSIQLNAEANAIQIIAAASVTQSVTFQQLSFPKQSLLFNQNGFANTDSFWVITANGERELPLVTANKFLLVQQ